MEALRVHSSLLHFFKQPKIQTVDQKRRSSEQQLKSAAITCFFNRHFDFPSEAVQNGDVIRPKLF